MEKHRIRYAHQMGQLPLRRKRLYMRHWYDAGEVRAIADFFDVGLPEGWEERFTP